MKIFLQKLFVLAALLSVQSTHGAEAAEAAEGFGDHGPSIDGSGSTGGQDGLRINSDGRDDFNGRSRGKGGFGDVTSGSGKNNPSSTRVNLPAPIATRGGSLGGSNGGAIKPPATVTQDPVSVELVKASVAALEGPSSFEPVNGDVQMQVKATPEQVQELKVRLSQIVAHLQNPSESVLSYDDLLLQDGKFPPEVSGSLKNLIDDLEKINTAQKTVGMGKPIRLSFQRSLQTTLGKLRSDIKGASYESDIADFLNELDTYAMGIKTKNGKGVAFGAPTIAPDPTYKFGDDSGADISDQGGKAPGPDEPAPPVIREANLSDMQKVRKTMMTLANADFSGKLRGVFELLEKYPGENEKQYVLNGIKNWLTPRTKTIDGKVKSASIADTAQLTSGQKEIFNLIVDLGKDEISIKQKLSFLQDALADQNFSDDQKIVLMQLAQASETDPINKNFLENLALDAKSFQQLYIKVADMQKNPGNYAIGEVTQALKALKQFVNSIAIGRTGNKNSDLEDFQFKFMGSLVGRVNALEVDLKSVNGEFQLSSQKPSLTQRFSSWLKDENVSWKDLLKAKILRRAWYGVGDGTDNTFTKSSEVLTDFTAVKTAASKVAKTAAEVLNNDNRASMADLTSTIDALNSLRSQMQTLQQMGKGSVGVELYSQMDSGIREASGYLLEQLVLEVRAAWIRGSVNSFEGTVKNFDSRSYTSLEEVKAAEADVQTVEDQLATLDALNSLKGTLDLSKLLNPHATRKIAALQKVLVDNNNTLPLDEVLSALGVPSRASRLYKDLTGLIKSPATVSFVIEALQAGKPVSLPLVKLPSADFVKQNQAYFGQYKTYLKEHEIYFEQLKAYNKQGVAPVDQGVQS